MSCVPNMQARCKVRLFYKAFKYDGKCYNCCGNACCPSIVICMRRVDATAHINCGRAEFIPDDCEVECTLPGACCPEEAGCC